MQPREYACDRDTHFGRLDKALDEVRKAGWLRFNSTTALSTGPGDKDGDKGSPLEL